MNKLNAMRATPKIKPHFVLAFFAIVILASCKKNGHESGNAATHEKKWVVTTVAGDLIPNYRDGAIANAEFKHPMDIAVAADGTLFIADLFNHRIRKISGGQVSTVAGFGIQDTTNGTGTGAGYGFPSRLITDAQGNIFTLDAADARVRKITPAGVVSTYAGTVQRGYAEGPALSAKFGQSFGIVMDANGNLYIADSDNHRVRKITQQGIVSTIAGSDTAGFTNGDVSKARFFFPQGCVLDKEGNLFVADQNRIRKITPSGVVSTFVGTEATGFADGDASQATFSLIEDMVIDEQSNLYVTDENRIRKITPQGIVTTIAGSVQGYRDGEGSLARFNAPMGLGIDSQGLIYVADFNNSLIRKISFE